MPHSKAKVLEDQYDVFLSFSGDDTRCNFMPRLRKGLEAADSCSIRVFTDEKKIKKGDSISEKILPAINNSQIYIPIISQTYPDREWCLIELAHMMNNVSQSEDRKRIFPIFYKVKPGDIKHRIPHLENPFSEGEVRLFKEALANVGQINGWLVKEGQSQQIIIDSVVQEVLEELGQEHGSQTVIEPDDRTESLKDILTCAIECVKLTWNFDMVQVPQGTGRGSLSRGNTERSRPSRTSTEKWKMENIKNLEARGKMRLMRSELRGSLRIGEVGSLQVEHSEGREEVAAVAEGGGAGGEAAEE